jgi:hypothetical protein
MNVLVPGRLGGPNVCLGDVPVPIPLLGTQAYIGAATGISCSCAPHASRIVPEAGACHRAIGFETPQPASASLYLEDGDVAPVQQNNTFPVELKKKQQLFLLRRSESG